MLKKSRKHWSKCTEKQVPPNHSTLLPAVGAMSYYLFPSATAPLLQSFLPGPGQHFPTSEWAAPPGPPGMQQAALEFIQKDRTHQQGRFCLHPTAVPYRVCKSICSPLPACPSLLSDTQRSRAHTGRIFWDSLTLSGPLGYAGMPQGGLVMMTGQH